jgi:hypothetical protein
MKKLIISSLIVGSLVIASITNADWGNSDGHQSFVAELNLDAERAEKMDAVLDSYRQVPKLYFTGRSDEIPEFLAEKDAELEALLTPEELTQFKQSFGEWAKKKNFKFMKFSFLQTQPAIEPTYQVPDNLRQQIRENLDSQLMEAGQQLRGYSLNA